MSPGSSDSGHRIRHLSRICRNCSSSNTSFRSAFRSRDSSEAKMRRSGFAVNYFTGESPPVDSIDELNNVTFQLSKQGYHHHHNDDRAARRPHILCSICVHSSGALAKAARFFIASFHNQPMCSVNMFLSSTFNQFGEISKGHFSSPVGGGRGGRG